MRIQPAMRYGAGLLVILTVVTAVSTERPAQGAEADATFVAVEKEGSKIWEGGGTVTIGLAGRKGEPLTLRVSNPLAAEHGFSIDTMNIKEVIKPGEEKTIIVPLENIDTTVSEHRVYCQLHPKHVAATLRVAGT
ncbi:MAG: hypothetical protein AB1515_08545 [Nitrospirota bacterium]